MLVIRNAIAEAVKGAFSGRDRAALVEAVLARALSPDADLAGRERGQFTLTLDQAQSIDTGREKVAIEVSPEGTITVTPTTGTPAEAKGRAAA